MLSVRPRESFSSSIGRLSSSGGGPFSASSFASSRAFLPRPRAIIVVAEDHARLLRPLVSLAVVADDGVVAPNACRAHVAARNADAAVGPSSTNRRARMLRRAIGSAWIVSAAARAIAG